MSRTLFAVVLAGSLGLLVAVVPLGAHHSEAAEFDATKPVRVTGVVKKVEWTNPHIWFYVEGKDEVTGQAAVWGFSGAAPNGLRRRGSRRGRAHRARLRARPASASCTWRSPWRNSEMMWRSSSE